MKKNLFTLLLLLVLGSTAYADYKFNYPGTVELPTIAGGEKTISFGETANITAFACSLKTANKYTYQDMLIGSTKGGSDLYKGNPGGGSSTSFIYHSKTVSCSTATIYFEHPALCAARTCKDMVFTIATATPSIADAVLSSTTTCTFNVFSGTEISTSDFTSTDENFAVTAVSLVNGYCYSVTISFSPTALGTYSSTIKLNGEDAATVSAKGLPTPTVALEATDVTFNSFTANWEASDLEGATYTIEVKDANDIVIASASGLEETSYAVSELDPESIYTYVIYVSVGDATSEASNTISVTTLAKPAITPAQYEYKLTSDTGIEGYTSIIITAVNVTEATATVTGDAEFYFKDADGNPVTTKTVAIEAEGPTEFELFSYFYFDGEYSATITLSAEGADNASVSVIAEVSIPTNVVEQNTPSKVKSFNNGLLEFNEDYASIVVSTLNGKTVAKGQGHTIALAKGQTYIVETVDFEGKKSTVKVQ